MLSRAYVDAVAAAARCTTETPTPDYDGVDVEIRQTAAHSVFSEARLGLQLKATSQNLVSGDHLSFPLAKPHYDKLRDPKVYVARILVVMMVPTGEPAKWLYQHSRAMLLKHCAYWVSLRDGAAITTASRTVHVPLAQPFTVSQLQLILQRVGTGGLP